MKKIYIDVRHSFAVSSQSGKFNGGNNYSKRIIEILLGKVALYNTFPVIICSSGASQFIKEVFSLYDFNCMEQDEITNLSLEKDDVYYSPLTSDTSIYANELEKFRSLNPNAKIYLTIHDRRHVENWYDKYDGILKSGIKSNPILLAVGRALHSLKIEKSLNKIVCEADKIITVSNYSMQS